MLSVNTSNIQNQNTTPIQKKSSDQNQKPVKSAANFKNGNTVNFPEDVVSLSTSITRNPENKKPSTPVSNAEKGALLKTSDGKPSFSIYA